MTPIHDPAGRAQILESLVVIIPAFNEEESIAAVLAEIRACLPRNEMVVINDGSCDRTTRIAQAAGATVLDLACNLGVGGAVQAGYRYAVRRGYRYAVRLDGDGQHPPADIPRLVDALAESQADLILGSRFLGGNGYTTSTPVRALGIRALAWFLSAICRLRVTDPTSGFWLVNRPLMRCFAADYPADYPEPEALALLRRQGYSWREVPVEFRARQHGRSSIHSWGTLYYALKVGLALVVDRMRAVDPLLSRRRLGEEP